MEPPLTFFYWFKQALFPEKCLICAEEGFILCPQHANFPPAKTVILPKNSALNACFAVADYNAPNVKAVISSLKFYRKKSAAKPMAQTLMRGINWQAFPNTWLIPMPLHWRRKHWRGFNQTELLAGYLNLKGISINVNTKALKKIRYTTQQASLSKANRRLNQINAFRWNYKYEAPETVLLFDDVMTTGSTLEAAAQALKNAGVNNVVGIVFAYQSPTRN